MKTRPPRRPPAGEFSRNRLAGTETGALLVAACVMSPRSAGLARDSGESQKICLADIGGRGLSGAGREFRNQFSQGYWSIVDCSRGHAAACNKGQGVILKPDGESRAVGAG